MYVVRQSFAWHGEVTVRVFRAGREVEREHHCNLVTDVGLDRLVECLTGAQADITDVALGGDDTEPDPGDEGLGDEQFRKQVTSQEVIGVGELSTVLFVSASEATDFVIEEIGWFIDGEDLFARVLYSRDKTDVESLQIDRTDRLVRAD